MDERLREILAGQLRSIWSRHLQTAKKVFEAMRGEAVGSGRFDSGFYRTDLDEAAAERLQLVADEAITETIQGIGLTGLPWTQQLGESVKSLLRSDVAQHAHALRTMANGFLRRDEAQIGDAVTRMEHRIVDGIGPKIDLLVYAEPLHRQPLLDALSAPGYEAVKEGVVKARKFLDSDPANAAKEAVNTVEQLAGTVAEMPKASLKKSLGALQAQERLPTPLVQTMLKVYGWASDHPGVRHGSAEPGAIDEAACRYAVGVAECAIKYLLEIPDS